NNSWKVENEKGRSTAARELMRGKLTLPNVILILYFSVLVCLGAPNAQSFESVLEQGVKLLSQGSFPAAISLFQQCKQTNPQDARPYFYTGLALTESGRLSAAALELDEAVRLDPQRLETLILQANLFARLKQNMPAEQALARLQNQGAERLEASWLW